MSTRERWIVYPLLFFALSCIIFPRLLNKVGGMSEIRCRTIDCQDLRVKTINGRPYLSQPVAIMVPNPTVSRAAAERDGDDQTVSPKTEAPPAESSGD